MPHTFLTVNDDFFDDNLLCVIDADETAVVAALTALGMTAWSVDPDDYDFSIFDGDLDDYFGDNNSWFDDNAMSDFSSPWAYAGEAADGCGSSAWSGAFRLADLVEFFTTGVHPLNVG